MNIPMPMSPNKKLKLSLRSNCIAAASLSPTPTPIFAFDNNEDILSMIFGYLNLGEIILARSVCKQWREVTMVADPSTNFVVNSVNRYNAMVMMAEWLPNLQRLNLQSLGREQKYIDGRDPDLILVRETANFATHGIEMVSSFRRLRVLEISCAPLNGRYHLLFNFSLLEHLSICGCSIKWDLGMLSGTPLLKELIIDQPNCIGLTGDISGLRVLRETLERVTMNCEVVGMFMELADFPCLKVVDLGRTCVVGDVRDIGHNDFINVEEFVLPETVCGGKGYKFPSVNEVNTFMSEVHRLIRQYPTLFLINEWCLDEDSPDFYWYNLLPVPPFHFHFVKAGSRLGWRWHNGGGDHCKVNWLDPEPIKGTVEYDIYMEEKNTLLATDMYSDFHEPPSENIFLLLHLQE